MDNDITLHVVVTNHSSILGLRSHNMYSLELTKSPLTSRETSRLTALAKLSEYSLVDKPAHGPPRTLFYKARAEPGLMYCRTAKTGSTFINGVLKQLPRRKYKHMAFTSVRNPWHRLVSTYLHWFNQGRNVKPPSGFCKNTLNSIPTFKAFVIDCVLPSWRRGQINVHWLPSVSRCLCKPEVKLDYIVVTENLMNELAYILETENLVDHPKPLLNRVRQSTIRENEKKALSKSFQEYYRDISLKDITELRRLYQDDIRILGYPDSPFVDSPFA